MSTLEGAVYGGEAWVKVQSFIDGMRVRANVAADDGQAGVALVLHGEADELTVAQMELLTTDKPPTLPPPTVLEVIVTGATLARMNLPSWAFVTVRGADAATGLPVELRIRAAGTSPWAGPDD